MCFLLHNNQTMGRGSKDQYCLLFSQVLLSCISVSSLEWPPLFFSVGRKGWLGNDGPSSFLTNFVYQPLPNFPPLPNIFAVTSLPTDQCWNGRQVDGCRIHYALWPKLEDLAGTIVTVYLRFHLSAFKRMICRHSWPILYLVASVSCVVLILDSLYTALCPSRSAPLTCCIRNSQFFQCTYPKFSTPFTSVVTKIAKYKIITVIIVSNVKKGRIVKCYSLGNMIEENGLLYHVLHRFARCAQRSSWKKKVAANNDGIAGVFCRHSLCKMHRYTYHVRRYSRGSRHLLRIQWPQTLLSHWLDSHTWSLVKA